ncbi:hypothetical protein Q5424_05030 [Conexibacter sp. JD483]|uniref:hypothetical protein n=1 Tax=unclassified Conexibacter TaxID=2627773 RepID=UPI002728D432|nr:MULTISPECIES: hypothetical protein [unclassified Conexibacter]MDO8184697.1 hypothetical protein [Conexibacter sp. CPCC 205706]MDO8198003.1 hypothetical protein [Conexibacter sp. CPCC 205762]MDR9368433.1 hypothetical protein [Conexibacter sp. JD483]
MRQIVMATHRLETSDPTQALGTLVHEHRHAVQHQVVLDGLQWRDPIEARWWGYAIHRIGEDAKNFVRYFYSPIEVDARHVQARVQLEYFRRYVGA